MGQLALSSSQLGGVLESWPVITDHGWLWSGSWTWGSDGSEGLWQVSYVSGQAIGPEIDHPKRREEQLWAVGRFGWKGATACAPSSNQCFCSPRAVGGLFSYKYKSLLSTLRIRKRRGKLCPVRYRSKERKERSWPQGSPCEGLVIPVSSSRRKGRLDRKWILDRRRRLWRRVWGFPSTHLRYRVLTKWYRPRPLIRVVWPIDPCVVGCI